MSSSISLKQAFAQPAALVLFFLGASSGLPFLLVGGTLSTWLKEDGVSIEQIGLFSLVGLSYSFKFLWSPLLDQIRLPLLWRLGKRKSWLLTAQCVLAASLAAMAILTPSHASLAWFVAATALAAFAGATQDVIIDAYRIEIAPIETQGALAATYSLGYRLALMVSGAFALFLADQIPWPMVYWTMAAFVLALMIVTLIAREPTHAPSAPRTLTESLRDGVIGPFQDFFQRFAGISGIVLLAFIGWFKISDQMLGVIAMPFYLDCGFTKTDIALVSKMFGVWIGIAGAFAGGASVVHFGTQASLFAGILIGAVSNLLYLLLAMFPGNLSIFVLVIGGENLAGGFLGTAAIAYLSALVNQRYTATQYALFSSIVTLPGKLIAGTSGFMVAAWGYPVFFIFSTLAAAPALAMFYWLRAYVRIERAD
ncbi:Signal transducer [gamma proteobacterium HdN1]|nr:Signal transducer [gamma proteobacterium HdN1]